MNQRGKNECSIARRIFLIDRGVLIAQLRQDTSRLLHLGLCDHGLPCSLVSLSALPPPPSVCSAWKPGEPELPRNY